LIVALVQGVIYVFIEPPWQHYDEPGHFEYAWLAANQQGWPKPGNYDQSMRREVAASMVEFDFYRKIGGKPNLLSIDQPIDIGFSQVGDVPVYYFIASLPLRIFKYTDITFQLYTVRLVSVLFFLITIWASLQTSKELFNEGHPLRWMVPLFMACLPGFVDLMTAANNDVAAIAFFTIFLWASTRVIHRGLNLKNLILLVAAVLLCAFTKSTAWLAVPFSLLAIMLGLFPKHRKFVWLAAVLASGLILVLAFSWNTTLPANVYASRNASLPLRERVNHAPVGKAIFESPNQPTIGDGFSLMINEDSVKELAGHPATIGFWAWANKPAEIPSPILSIGGEALTSSNPITLSTAPTFFSYAVQIPVKTGLGQLNVLSYSPDRAIKFYWDGFVLAKGEYSLQIIPKFDNGNALSGLWDTKQFTNYFSNGSGEKWWPMFRNRVGQLMDNKFNYSISSLWSILDLKSTGNYYPTTFSQLFRTYWARFSWGQVSLLGNRPYRVFVEFTGIALLGNLCALFLYRMSIPWTSVFFQGILTSIQLVVTSQRTGGNWFNYTFTPTARYFYPVIFPTAVFLVAGWFVSTSLLSRKNRIIEKIFACLFPVLLIAVSIWSILSISQY
jgi:hypothetical protein